MTKYMHHWSIISIICCGGCCLCYYIRRAQRYQLQISDKVDVVAKALHINNTYQLRSRMHVHGPGTGTGHGNVPTLHGMAVVSKSIPSDLSSSRRNSGGIESVYNGLKEAMDTYDFINAIEMGLASSPSYLSSSYNPSSTLQLVNNHGIPPIHPPINSNGNQQQQHKKSSCIQQPNIPHLYPNGN